MQTAQRLGDAMAQRHSSIDSVRFGRYLAVPSLTNQMTSSTELSASTQKKLNHITVTSVVPKSLLQSPEAASLIPNAKS